MFIGSQILRQVPRSLARPLVCSLSRSPPVAAVLLRRLTSNDCEKEEEKKTVITLKFLRRLSQHLTSSEELDRFQVLLPPPFPSVSYILILPPTSLSPLPSSSEELELPLTFLFSHIPTPRLYPTSLSLLLTPPLASLSLLPNPILSFFSPLYSAPPPTSSASPLFPLPPTFSSSCSSSSSPSHLILSYYSVLPSLPISSSSSSHFHSPPSSSSPYFLSSKLLLSPPTSWGGFKTVTKVMSNPKCFVYLCCAVAMC